MSSSSSTCTLCGPRNPPEVCLLGGGSSAIVRGPDMSQDNLIKLKSTKSDHVYFTRKNKKGEKKDKLEFKKYDPTTRKREVYKEAKK